MKTETRLRSARYGEPQVPDYNTSRLGEVLADSVRQMRETGENPFDRGPRDEGEPRPVPGPAKRGEKKHQGRLSPTHFERMNRALVELGHPAFKIHALLWVWRGAAAKGKLPFFTIHSLARLCRMDRKVVRRALGELVDLGWIERHRYDCHKKNELCRLVPIETVPKPGESAKESES
ncbi:hypothetical protein ES703_58741 [subsurface metagenome]